MEDRLSRALGGWAAASRLDAWERERMRTAILLTPEVDALWWDQFNQQMARFAARTQRPVARPRFGLEWGESPRLSWGAGG